MSTRRAIRPRSRAARLVALVVAVLSCTPPAPAAAETTYRVRGLLDLGLVSSVHGRDLNQLTMGDSNFDPYRLRLFLDARVAPGLELHAQTIFHEGMAALRADGAYALYTPWPERDLALEAGKIPLFVGTYAPRTYSDRNSLVGTPLMYQYRTSLVWGDLVPDADALVAQAGTGQLDLTKVFLPVVDERWWDTGAAVLGSIRPVEFAFGIVQGSPSWPSPGADNTPGLSVAGRLGLVPCTGVRLGVSATEGTWLPAWLAFALPPGASVRDYHERTLMGDVELARGPFELRGEAVHRTWETIATGDLEVDGGYGEARWALSCGAWLALRGEALRFSDITTSAGVRPWDDGVDRWEAVTGYRVTQDVRAKAGFQRTVHQPFGTGRTRDDLWFAQLGIRF